MPLKTGQATIYTPGKAPLTATEIPTIPPVEKQPIVPIQPPFQYDDKPLHRIEWLWNESLVTTIESPKQGIVSLPVSDQLPCRKIFSYLFPVATGAGDFFFQGVINLYYNHSLISALPFSTGDVSTTGIGASLIQVSPFTTNVPVENSMWVSLNGPLLTGESVNIGMLPLKLKITCDRVSINLLRAVNLASYRVILGIMSSDESYETGY